jgi:hypothetical protein
MLHKRNRRQIHAIVNLDQIAMGRIIRMKGATEFAYDSLGLKAAGHCAQGVSHD